ncbi:hypothetical protein LSH36_509g01044 [Paralvinella palmiformis]|uniref:Glutamate receptor n=1 Tax=Paralvinella palmiformis TaxID=53620 RepID=A0AAD9J8L8_9ANNE|nr:hypothetical protein LSH36_509g01044 [Paralvinella palmiformis]
MCNTLEIPHLEARLEPSRDPGHLFSVNMHPETSQLTRAYLDLLKLLKWTRFCVIYGDQSDLLLLQDIIQAPLQNDVEITVRQAKRGTMRETLKEIDKKGIRKILAHLNVDDTYMLLKSALQVGMIDPSHHYIFTNLDLETINLDDFKHNAANVTGFRLISREDPRVQDILHQMETYQVYSGSKILNSTHPRIIKTETALMYDAVYVLAHAVQQVDASTRLRLVNLSCEGDQAWAFGSSLYNYLNLVEMEGLTGRITFDRGRRYEFRLDVLQLKDTGLKKVGEWNPTDGLNFTSRQDMITSSSVFSNKTLIVTSLLEPPYVMVRKSEFPLIGNEQYEGFCIELLESISKIVGFKYKIELVPDGKYGALDKDGMWNGMVLQLLEKKADLAVTSLTINYVREQVIDFTKPFMNLGISILFKRPREESPGLFSFLNPLAIEIWIYVIAAYFVVSLIMFVLARFSPYEWYNPHPCNPDNGVMENIFTLSNSFWFAVGTLMQQGSDINPRAVSTRIVGGIWWFFTLIIISSYTANLAAFLTVERMVSPIESAEDLSKQTKIAYGTIQGGSTMTFFRDSRIPTYQRMWAFMENHEPSVFVKTSHEGIERVKKGNYAFLMESTMIDYTIQRKCGKFGKCEKQARH